MISWFAVWRWQLNRRNILAVGVFLFVLLMTTYFLLYLALSEATGVKATAITTDGTYWEMYPRYAIWNDMPFTWQGPLTWIFTPAHKIDKLLRPNRWPPPLEDKVFNQHPEVIKRFGRNEPDDRPAAASVPDPWRTR